MLASNRMAKACRFCYGSTLKLNARLLGFNVDPMFGGVLDGLMMVDLLDVDQQLLTRYLGKTGASEFLAHHDPTAGRRAS